MGQYPCEEKSRASVTGGLAEACVEALEMPVVRVLRGLNNGLH